MEACCLAMFVDASFAADLRDSKSTTGAYLCLFGPRTFVPIMWLCKKQSATSHSSTEAEVIALDAALRTEGIPLLQLWDEILTIMMPRTYYSPTQSHHPTVRPVTTPEQILAQVDYVQDSLPAPTRRGKMVIFEDNVAVLRMIQKGRSPTMRHVPRTHRVDLDWLLERIRNDDGIWIKYIHTTLQIADMLTKGANLQISTEGSVSP